MHQDNLWRILQGNINKSISVTRCAKIQNDSSKHNHYVIIMPLGKFKNLFQQNNFQMKIFQSDSIFQHNSQCSLRNYVNVM